jgi:hypothetical protein
VTVIGDGAVGLSGVLAARRLGAERIVLMGHHKDRTDLGREFGATDVVAERGEEGIELVRDGGVVSRVGAAQYTEVQMDFGTFLRNVTLTGGVAPARAYIGELMPDILDGSLQPGRVFDRAMAWTTCRTGTGPWVSGRR